VEDECLVISTDYPHSDSPFPHAIETFLGLDLPDESRRKVLWENCARFYRL
jgi:predicted TIM-barrel fold metal-dependent hydrolase